MPRLTAAQYSTLSFYTETKIGKTLMLTSFWRDRHHQALIRHGYLRLRADPFKTRAAFLAGWITGRGKRAVQTASEAVKAQSKKLRDKACVREQDGVRAIASIQTTCW